MTPTQSELLKWLDEAFNPFEEFMSGDDIKAALRSLVNGPTAEYMAAVDGLTERLRYLWDSDYQSFLDDGVAAGNPNGTYGRLSAVESARAKMEKS